MNLFVSVHETDTNVPSITFWRSFHRCEWEWQQREFNVFWFRETNNGGSRWSRGTI